MGDTGDNGADRPGEPRPDQLGGAGRSRLWLPAVTAAAVLAAAGGGYLLSTHAGDVRGEQGHTRARLRSQLALPGHYLTGGVTRPAASESATKGAGSHPGDGRGGAHPARMNLTQYSASGKTLTVRFWGSVCERYTARAAQGSTKVTVTVTGRSEAKRNCIMIAKRHTLRVHLDTSLDDRKVIDGRDHKAIPSTSAKR